jgi:hypothetical protein
MPPGSIPFSNIMNIHSFPSNYAQKNDLNYQESIKKTDFRSCCNFGSLKVGLYLLLIANNFSQALYLFNRQDDQQSHTGLIQIADHGAGGSNKRSHQFIIFDDSEQCPA